LKGFRGARGFANSVGWIARRKTTHGQMPLNEKILFEPDGKDKRDRKKEQKTGTAPGLEARSGQKRLYADMGKKGKKVGV